MFSASKAALTSPLPHVYQADAQGNSVPVLPHDELRQEAATNLQTGATIHAGSVKVAELDQISNYHVSARNVAVTPYHGKLTIAADLQPVILVPNCGVVEHWIRYSRCCVPHTVYHTDAAVQVSSSPWCPPCNAFNSVMYRVDEP